MTCMEMVSAKAITYRNEKTWDLMKTVEEERPVVLQLFGSEPEILAQAKEMIRDIPYDILDVNMGCPMPKIVNNGEGSALMKAPEKIEEIVRALAPVTVKLRSGWDADHINAVECALAAEAGGASAVTIHARTRDQYYMGSADYNVIRAVKDALQIPVMGSGDVRDGVSARRMFEETGCDGLMIARAAQGNPFVFREVTGFLQGDKDIAPPTDAELLETVLRHARMLTEQKGEYIAVREMRKHLSWYTTGRKGSARVRARMSSLTDMESLEQMCREVFDKQG